MKVSVLGELPKGGAHLVDLVAGIDRLGFEDESIARRAGREQINCVGHLFDIPPASRPQPAGESAENGVVRSGCFFPENSRLGLLLWGPGTSSIGVSER